MAKRDYQKALDVAELRAGYFAALDQAEALAEEATLLLEHERYPGAYHRLVMALEELGKMRLFLCQGAIALGGEDAPWKRFWSAYYTHTAKLRLALLSIDTLDLLSGETGEEIKAALASVVQRATELDSLKQSSSYSGIEGGTFARPTETITSRETAPLRATVNVLLELLRSRPLSSCRDDGSFQDELLRSYRYANALGYIGSTTDVFHDLVADGNQPVWVADRVPTDEQFLARVAERYEVLPSRLRVTLPVLAASPEFRSFLRRIRERFGYPDWVVLGTVFNIALHARVDVAQYAAGGRIDELLSFAEDPVAHKPLDVSLFTDEKTFELFLDAWLVSFLVGLGLLPQPLGTPPDGRSRRVAARYYGLFDRDVEHPSLFGDG